MKGKIFNAQEVQAIIAGTKTMFREVIKPQPILNDDKSYWEFKGIRWAGENSSYAKNFGDNARPEMPDLCPYQVKQKIFVKRLTLEIIDIKVERLQDISEEDAFKEGTERTDEWTGCADDLFFKDAFKFNWNAKHKKPEEKFEANPFVWVIDFKINKIC